MLKILLALAALLLWPAAAHAQSVLDQARAAILANRLDAAAQLLGQVDPRSADPNDLDFLEGELASAKGDYPAAIGHFKAVLARDASLNRVRLDLARAEFLKGDDTAAAYHFRAAMAQGVPPDVQHNIDGFLDAIRRRKRWDVSVQASLAPDSNINAATSAESVSLYGLPFQLDPTARHQSGLGVSGSVSAAYQWDLGATTRLRTGAAYFDSEYTDQSFTDRNLALYAGPRFLLSPGYEISVLATGSQRWIGGRAFTTSAGGRIEGEAQLSPRLTLGGAPFAQHNKYAEAYDGYSGPAGGLSLVLTAATGAEAGVRVLGSLVRERARDQPLRDSQYGLGLGYYTALRHGFATYLEVRGTLVPYDAPLAAFGVTRRDREIDTRVSLSNRRLDFHGFTPLLSWIHTSRHSNIALYSYTRDRVEIGVVRNF